LVHIKNELPTHKKTIVDEPEARAVALITVNSDDVTE